MRQEGSHNTRAPATTKTGGYTNMLSAARDSDEETYSGRSSPTREILKELDPNIDDHITRNIDFTASNTGTCLIYLVGNCIFFSSHFLLPSFHKK